MLTLMSVSLDPALRMCMYISHGLVPLHTPKEVSSKCIVCASVTSRTQPMWLRPSEWVLEGSVPHNPSVGFHLLFMVVLCVFCLSVYRRPLQFRIVKPVWP